MSMSSLERVATDPLLLPLPVPLSPLVPTELDSFFPVSLARDDTIGKPSTNDKVYMLMRDSFQLVSQVMSSLDADNNGGCQSYANEKITTPSIELTRLLTMQSGVDRCDDWGLKQQSSDLTFIDSVMSSTSVIRTIHSPEAQLTGANQNALTPLRLIRSSSFRILETDDATSRMSDTDDTMSPPSADPLHLITWGTSELCEQSTIQAMPTAITETTPTISEATPTTAEATPTVAGATPTTAEATHTVAGATPTRAKTLPPKPALIRMFSRISHPQEQCMDTTECSMVKTKVNINYNTHTPTCTAMPCLKSRKMATPRLAKKLQVATSQQQQQQRVTFRKIVKVNTAGEVELSAIRSSNTGEPVELSSAQLARTSCTRRRNHQQNQQQKRELLTKTWHLRPSTISSSRRTSAKSQISKTVTKMPVRTTRESLTPARFFFESKLQWTRWRPCFLPKPTDKSWTPSTICNTGFVNSAIFRKPGFDPSSIGRPTMYELAVTTPNSHKKFVVFCKVTNSAKLSVPLERFLSHGQPRLIAQIENVISQGCKVVVRRGILDRKLVLPAGNTKIQITCAQRLRSLIMSGFDYAWSKRTVQHRGYVISEAFS